jgi:hypothetical protein
VTVPETPGDRDIRRRIASRANDAAWALIERPQLDPAETAQLLTLAGTARHHWHEVGTPPNAALADLLFAWAMARAGAGAAALQLATEALGQIDALAGAAWQQAFAHAAMAAACNATGDERGFAQHHAAAARLGATLSGEDATYFHAAFRTIPAGGGD